MENKTWIKWCLENMSDEVSLWLNLSESVVAVKQNWCLNVDSVLINWWEEILWSEEEDVTNFNITNKFKDHKIKVIKEESKDTIPPLSSALLNSEGYLVLKNFFGFLYVFDGTRMDLKHLWFDNHGNLTLWFVEELSYEQQWAIEHFFKNKNIGDIYNFTYKRRWSTFIWKLVFNKRFKHYGEKDWRSYGLVIEMYWTTGKQVEK